MNVRLKLFLSIVGVAFGSLVAQAQTVKLSGKVINEKNEPLPSVSVKIVGANGGVSTDIDGRFIINLIVGKKYELEFSTVGYQTKNISDVEVISGQANELNVILSIKAKTGETVVVTANRSTARRETISAAIAFQKNTYNVAQIVSAESIRRSPDKNTGEILKRIPGTSIQEGKYIVVRGLPDRYNQAMLNGILLSSTEPDRKTFSFDIFPAPMIDNIVVNKAFVPEYSGEWAGGLIQVNTKDVPTTSFLNVLIGANFNTQTIGRDFYTYKGGKYDWLGFDDGTRALPSGFPLKSDFNLLTAQQKTDLGKTLENVWTSEKNSSNFLPALGQIFQINGGFNHSIGKKNKLGGMLGLTYNRTNKRLDYDNAFFEIQNNISSLNFNYTNEKYSQDILEGAIGNLTLQLGNDHKISWKNILNVSTTDYLINRTGKDYEANPVNGEQIRASELAFRANTFFNTQLTGDHNLPSLKSKLRWFGSFNILDQYIPDQRRIQYNQPSTGGDYSLLVSNTRSQKSGSRFFQNLNDYIYTLGGDWTTSFNLFNFSQSVKGGYMLQIKDRLFDSRPFANYLSIDNASLRKLPADEIFAPENFGNGTDNKFGFDELYGNQYRYLANTILNAGYIQLDNQFTSKLRAVWGVRVEDYDQLIGSVKASDPRHTHSQVRDYLPALNLTYKLNNKTNIRLAGSQTLIRPEFRELTNFTFYDFELGAGVLGSSDLKRTKVTNADLRYELYPRSGELFTVGVFYKYFNNPIELYFNQSGVGTNTFNYINADNATSYGAEIEFRKRLDFSSALKNFTVQGNVSYIYNRVKKENAQLDRPMQGQSPYLINAAIQYDLEKAGLSTTLLFNVIGRRILYVGNQDIPSVWEAPRPLADLQIAKKIIHNKGELKLNISDFLNRPAYFYHDLDEDGKYIKNSADALAINRNYGTSISLTFGYIIK